MEELIERYVPGLVYLLVLTTSEPWLAAIDTDGIGVAGTRHEGITRLLCMAILVLIAVWSLVDWMR